MALSLQVIYPVTADTNFDYDYYTSTHMDVVGRFMGSHIESTVAIKGVAGGPDAPQGFYAITTNLFKDRGALDAAMAVSGPVLADVRNFTNAQPQILIGEVIG